MARTAKPRNGRERSARIPETTVLKLFVYPGKDGMISSYPTQYCVGFEMSTTRELTDKEMEFMPGRERIATYVSQQYITQWTESYEDATKSYEAWVDRLRCEEVVARKRRAA